MPCMRLTVFRLNFTFRLRAACKAISELTVGPLDHPMSEYDGDGDINGRQAVDERSGLTVSQVNPSCEQQHQIDDWRTQQKKGSGSLHPENIAEQQAGRNKQPESDLASDNKRSDYGVPLLL